MLVENVIPFGVNYFIYVILKRGLEKEYINFFDFLIKRCKEENYYFRYRYLPFKPYGYKFCIHVMEKLGLIEKINKSTRGTWKIKNINEIKKILDILKRCEEDENFRESTLKLMNNLNYEKLSNQNILWRVARLIAKKEGINPTDALVSISIAYYIENYGEDREIKEIIKKIKIMNMLNFLLFDEHADAVKDEVQINIE